MGLGLVQTRPVYHPHPKPVKGNLAENPLRLFINCI